MTTSKKIPEHIFKSYDVRGKFGDEIDEETATLIGQAVVQTLSARSIAVGRDMRVHSPRLEAALVDGITRAGANVVLLGQCSTPMSYFAAATLDVDGAIMITASHNPSRDNGFKFSKRGGEPMGDGTGLEKVRDLVLSGEASVVPSCTPGTATSVDLLDSWCTHLQQYVSLRPMKVVVDCGNGVMGPLLHEIIRRVDPTKMLDIIWLFDEPDGNFPWHPADPMNLSNLQHLQGAVLATSADLGVAFDGDGDRLVFIDENARFIGGDLTTALFAGHLLSKPENKGKHVLYDLRSSAVVKETIEAAGGVGEMCRVGHSHIKAAMRGFRKGTVLDPDAKGEVIFAGEISGHFFFADCFKIDTSERAFLLALAILAEKRSSMSECVLPLRKYWHSSEISYVMTRPENMQAVLKRVAEEFANEKIFRLDGVSVASKTWHFNVRLSNTEPLIRLSAESLESQQGLRDLVSRLDHLIVELGGTRRGLALV